jgi:hypothetical protein
VCSSLYIQGYNDQPARRGKRAAHLAHELAWSQRLPAAWRDQVVTPLWVKVQRDQASGAERWLGFDEEDAPCFVRQCFSIPVGDDVGGEVGLLPAQAVAHGEDLMAWQMRDGRWLIHRIIVSQAHARPRNYSFYAFSESMPR